MVRLKYYMTGVTLADEDTDIDNVAILGHVAMQVELSGGQI